MNGLLAMVESFLDHMTNPQYGTEVNEEYSLRFNLILAADPGFAVSLAGLALDPEDTDSLPTCAWPWYLEWRTERAGPPSVDFLDALFEATDDPGVRLAVLQSALSDDGEPQQDEDGEPRRDGDGEPRPDDSPAPPTEPRPDSELAERGIIQSRWLRARRARLAAAPGEAGALADTVEIATYLLQLGDIPNLRALLDRGPEALRATVGRQLATAGLDPETEARWRSELGLASPTGTS
jgi:hypothetical protein